MNRDIDLKDQIINEIRVTMEPLLSTRQLDILIYTISKILYSIKVEKDESLPSINVMTNEKLIQNFIICKKIEGLSVKTLNAYLYTIKKMISMLNMNIIDIDANIIRYYLLDYSKYVSNVTVDNARRNLNSFFKWLETEGYIEKNPLSKIRKVKCEKKIKTPLTTVEVQKIKDACRDMRETALIDLMCSTGVRCEEITKIKIDDVNLQTQTILIKGKGAKQREVYLDDVSMLHITQYISQRKQNSKFLFCNRKGEQLSTGSMSWIVRKIGKRAGVEKCQIHRFRKYFATTLFNRGCDVVYVKQLLGHSKLDTTMIYVQTSNARIKEEFNHFIA